MARDTDKEKLIPLFINQLAKGVDEESLKYYAGKAYKYNDTFIVGYEQMGAQDTFSIGQPIYDEEGNLMGYLGIGLLNSLDYATYSLGDEYRTLRVPVETWQICLPTKHCIHGKKIVTYWQHIHTYVEETGDNNGKNDIGRDM